MALKYMVLGAGAMGLRFGVLLQELAGAKVDFVDNWAPQVETIKQQGGFTFLETMRIDILYQLIFTHQKNMMVIQMCLSFLPNR